MKIKREHYLSREQAEKLFQNSVASIRKIRGYVNVDVRATVLISKHSV
jgi:hypothetical protein